MTDFKLLVTSTLTLYSRALKSCAANLIHMWWMPLAHLVVVVVLSIPLTIVMSLFGIVGGFMAGLALAFAVGAYLASLSVAHRKDSAATIPSLSKAMFFPVIHVLFLFFIIDLVLSFVAGSAETYWIRASVALLVAIFANVVPESIYVHGRSGNEMFSESVEFILENWAEWFLPFLLLFPLGWAFGLSFSLESILSLLSLHPFDLVERLMLMGGTMARIPSFLPFLVAAFYLLFAIALFRASLFEQLSSSTRRKRMYAQRTGLDW